MTRRKLARSKLIRTYTSSGVWKNRAILEREGKYKELENCKVNAKDKKNDNNSLKDDI